MKASLAVTQRIKELCKEKGLSYYMLSYKAAVSMSTLMSIINGGNTTITTINRICNGLEISLTQFFNAQYFNNCEMEDD